MLGWFRMGQVVTSTGWVALEWVQKIGLGWVSTKVMQVQLCFGEQHQDCNAKLLRKSCTSSSTRCCFRLRYKMKRLMFAG